MILMGMTPTLIVLACALAGVFWAWWQDRKPYVPGQLPLIPYMAILFICLIVAVVMAAHMIELFTGTPFKGRFSGR